MSWARVVFARVRGLFAGGRRDDDLDDEIRFHLEMQIEDNVKGGMNPEEARFAALRSFGGVQRTKEAYRERRALPSVETIAQDMRYALRTLRKSPGFATTSILVLALAMGASTAMFSVINAVLLRPLPYRAPEQLAMLWTEIPAKNIREGRTAYWNIEQWQRESSSFEDFAVFDPVSVTLSSDDAAKHISAIRSSPNVFALLGVQPLRGRIFSADDTEQRRRVALISYRFWQNHFGSSPGALGATIVVDGIPCKVVGVLPTDLPPFDFDVWQPYTMFPDWDARRAARGSGSWFVLGRLRPNVTFGHAQAEMTAIARGLDEQLPASDRNRGISVVPLDVQITGPRARLALWMLAGAVFCVLLIGASNVASLMLARSASRESEFAIRAALGASRMRLIRQLFAESFTLALLSGVLGIALAVVTVHLIVAFQPVNLTRLGELSLDPLATAYACAICFLTAVVVAFTPALSIVRRSLTGSLRKEIRSDSSTRAPRRVRRGLVVTQFALAIILLVGAGLMMRSLWSLEHVDLGFRAERVLSLQIAAPAATTPAWRSDFYRRVIERLQRVPGIESAGVIENFFVGSGGEQVVTTDGEPTSTHLRLRADAASDLFFETVGTPLLRGRSFSVEDGSGSQRVAIVNRTMVRLVWGARDPIGRRFKLGGVGPWFTVVGEVGDMRRHGLEQQAAPQMFEPLDQDPPRLGTLLVRTSVDDSTKISGIVTAVVHDVDKNIPVYGIATLESQVGAFAADRRFQTSLLMWFSAVALLMAAVAIYGIVQYSVAMRTREIGVRMAVGAQARDVFRLIIGEGLRLGLLGVAIGLGGALCVSRAAASLLFGVVPTDPLTFCTASLLLIAVAVLASYLPSRRATRVDAMTALRHD